MSFHNYILLFNLMLKLLTLFWLIWLWNPYGETYMIMKHILWWTYIYECAALQRFWASVGLTRTTSLKCYFSLCRICVIAGNISPIDVITHVPILCEEANVPYIYVPSKEVSSHVSCFKAWLFCYSTGFKNSVTAA